MNLQIEKYKKLNEIAIKNGVVIFGEDTDVEIPASELAQSFEFDFPIYNRSYKNLGINDAINLYNETIKPLNPEVIFIHIGKNNTLLEMEDKINFEQTYIKLIEHIKETNKKCKVVVVGVNDKLIDQQLKHIADSTKSEYGDIASVKVWSPQATKSITSFVQTMDVRRYCKSKPIYDLLKVIFTY